MPVFRTWWWYDKSEFLNRGVYYSMSVDIFFYLPTTIIGCKQFLVNKRNYVFISGNLDTLFSFK